MSTHNASLPVVVTGAASGIGAATASLLRERGHRVIGVDLRDAEVIGDLSTAAGRSAAVNEVAGAAPEGIAGVIPCAGIAGLTGVDSQLLVAINYFGAVELVERLRPLLVKGAQAAGSAAVVLLSSNSVTCQPGWNSEVAAACLTGDEEAARTAASGVEAVHCYPASKAALAHWVRRHCVEWAKDGIRLNSIAPGLIATPMTEKLRADPVFGVFADAYPSALNRPGTPQEVAEVLAFLVSPASSLMVGSMVFVDGGTDALMNPPTPLVSGVDNP